MLSGKLCGSSRALVSYRPGVTFLCKITRLGNGFRKLTFPVRTTTMDPKMDFRNVRVLSRKCAVIGVSNVNINHRLSLYCSVLGD